MADLLRTNADFNVVERAEASAAEAVAKLLEQAAKGKLKKDQWEVPRRSGRRERSNRGALGTLGGPGVLSARLDERIRWASSRATRLAALTARGVRVLA